VGRNIKVTGDGGRPGEGGVAWTSQSEGCPGFPPLQLLWILCYSCQSV
jgi:hypothetical protein